MSLNLKDAVYLLIYVISIAAVYFKFNNRLHNIEKARKREYNILWQNGGRLNLVDHKTCREFRDNIWEAMRKCDDSATNVINKLEVINEKLIRIDGKIKGD